MSAHLQGAHAEQGAADCTGIVLVFGGDNEETERNLDQFRTAKAENAAR